MPDDLHVRVIDRGEEKEADKRFLAIIRELDNVNASGPTREIALQRLADDVRQFAPDPDDAQVWQPRVLPLPEGEEIGMTFDELVGLDPPPDA